MPVLFLPFHSLLCVHWKPHDTERENGLSVYYLKSFQQSIFEFAYFPFVGFFFYLICLYAIEHLGLVFGYIQDKLLPAMYVRKIFVRIHGDYSDP